MEIISLFDKKRNTEILVKEYQIKNNVKSGANIAKKAIIVNNDTIITKNHKVTFMCLSCGARTSQMYQKCYKKLMNEKPLCQYCTRSVSHKNPTKQDLEKRFKTKLERYGNGNNVEKIRETMEKKYGDSNPFRFQSERSIMAMIKKYGVENPQQLPEIHMKSQSKSHKGYGVKTINENLHYQSNIEKIFIDKCFENNLKVKDADCFWYKYEGKNSRYFPDFIIGNTVFEIKSNHHWWREEVESGIAKLKKESVLNSGFDFVLLFDYEINYFNYKKYTKDTSSHNPPM